ncbi:MAG: hypothetical protein ABIM74_02445 [candidate division WOR-3 bacterium]
MRRSLLAFFALFVLLFPLAWANSAVYSEARALAERKAELARARREYNLVRSRLAKEERLLAIEERAKAIGMSYPEGIGFDQDKGNSDLPPSLVRGNSLALDLAPGTRRE